MFSLFMLLAFLFFLAILVAAANKAKQKSPLDTHGIAWPYQVKRLLTEREQVLLHRLREAFPDHHIFSQVALSQVIAVKARTKNAGAWLNKINQKSLDFVICRPDSSVLVVIELDDRSHDTAKQTARDADKSKALQDTGVRLLRVRDIPSREELVEQISKESVQ